MNHLLLIVKIVPFPCQKIKIYRKKVLGYKIDVLMLDAVCPKILSLSWFLLDDSTAIST